MLVLLGFVVVLLSVFGGVAGAVAIAGGALTIIEAGDPVRTVMAVPSGPRR